MSGDSKKAATRDDYIELTDDLIKQFAADSGKKEEFEKDPLGNLQKEFEARGKSVDRDALERMIQADCCGIRPIKTSLVHPAKPIGK